MKHMVQPDTRLMLMHDNSSSSGKSWFVVPGGKVTEEIAKHIISRHDVVEQADGLFPNHPQTWKVMSW